jgi:hypothetical protein
MCAAIKSKEKIAGANNLFFDLKRREEKKRELSFS